MSAISKFNPLTWVRSLIDSVSMGFDDMSSSFAPVKSAARKFRPDRGQWYQHVADMLDLSDGKMNVMTILERDASRYAGMPRGILAKYWFERYIENGAKLGEAMRGTLPPEDVALITVAEQNATLPSTLRELAASTEEIEAARNAFMQGISAPAVALAIAIGCILVVTYVIIPTYVTNFAAFPPDRWGPVGKTAYKASQFVRTFGWFIGLVLGGGFTWLLWSMRNYTGPRREWLDRHVVFYQLFRDLQGPIFITQLASLVRRDTSRMGTPTLTLPQALERIHAHTFPWLRWRIEQMLERHEEKPNDMVHIMSIGAFDNRILYLLADLQEVAQLEESMDKVAKHSLSNVKHGMPKRIRLLKYSMIGLAIATFGVMYILPPTINIEFQSLIKRSYR